MSVINDPTCRFCRMDTLQQVAWSGYGLGEVRSIRWWIGQCTSCRAEVERTITEEGKFIERWSPPKPAPLNPGPPRVEAQLIDMEEAK